MYQKEATEGFDSWQQDDCRDLVKQTLVSTISRYNFNNILDVGCGKGAITQFLKKENNTVTGIDLSHTAIKQAQQRFPDINFLQADVQEEQWISKLGSEAFDLCICSQVLSYLKDWKEFLRTMSEHTQYIAIELYLPQDPIGFIKSFTELEAAFFNFFEIKEKIFFETKRNVILFGKTIKN